MQYMINVDREASNIGGGANDCQSALHERLGDHFDLTIHALGCQIRGRRAVNRPPSRFWDDNTGKGYSLNEVVQRIRELRSQPPEAHPRRCRICGAEAHLPDWD